MSNQPRNYFQGKASATAGRGNFALIPKGDRVEFYHRSIVLARIFAAPNSCWVLKGGSALVWRNLEARSTRDLDIFNQSTQDIRKAIQDFEAALNEVSTAPRDISFKCESNPDSVTVAGNRQSTSIRVHLIHESGRRIPSPISIDLVVGCQVTGDIEQAPARSLEEVLQTNLPPVLLYPLVDHLADKVAATMQVYSYVGGQKPSTRVKDLVDIIHMALTESIDGRQLREALESERLERSLSPYSEGFVCPEAWALEYEKKKTKKGKAPESYTEALSIAKALLDPAIRGEADGRTWVQGEWK